MSINLKEFSGIRDGRDVTRSFVEFLGNFIPQEDAILLEKSGGDLKLYEKVMQDDRVKSCYTQRFAGLTSKKLEVLPGGEKRIDKQAAEYLQKQLEKINWDDITEKMLYGVHYGYSIAECIYGREDGKVILFDIRVRNRRRFHFGYDQLPKLVTFANPLGEDLPPQKFWHFSIGADHHDSPYGQGIGHWLYWLTWFKRNDLKWWITFLENFADPATIGKYPIGTTKPELATLEGAVQSVGKRKWSVIPEGMQIELLEASRSGTSDYQGMYDVLNTSISQVILGQNMTTESGSSESQARVHQDVGASIIEGDDALISGSFTAQVATWITEWNFPGAAIPIVRRKLEPEEDLKASAERDKLIVDMGFPANPDYIVEKYGEGFKPAETELKPNLLNAAELTAFTALIGQAQTGGWSAEMVQISLEIAFPHIPEDLIAKMAKSVEGSKPEADPNAAPPNLDDAQFADAPDLVDAYVGRLEEQDHFKPWLKQAQEVLMHSSDLNDFSDKLDSLYPDLSSVEFSEAMRGALTAASMGGYFEADSEIEGELEFKQSGTEIPADVYPLLISIINESYTDKLDRITSARENDDGSILVVGIDGGKQIACEISNDRIRIKILNPDAAEFAAPRKSNGSIKKKTCKTGLSCGGTCISKAKICARALSIDQQKLFKELKKRLKGGDTGAAQGIQDLKDEQQGIKKEPKKMSTPTTPAAAQKAMFVDVKSIKATSKASDFDAKEIESIANSILDAGGLYRPLLVEQDGLGYKLLPGHDLNYHAAVRAKEIDVAKGEMVNAFVVNKDYSDTSVDQVNRIEKADPKFIEPKSEFIKKTFNGKDDKSMFIDVKSISSGRPASDFDPKELEDLADSMLANGGLLRPMVLGKTGMNGFEEKYEVIDGHMAYHAAVIAKKKDIKRAEMVNGFVIAPENIKKVTKQLKLVK